MGNAFAPTAPQFETTKCPTFLRAPTRACRLGDVLVVLLGEGRLEQSLSVLLVVEDLPFLDLPMGKQMQLLMLVVAVVVVL